jgi:hypothetical protein
MDSVATGLGFFLFPNLVQPPHPSSSALDSPSCLICTEDLSGAERIAKALELWGGATLKRWASRSTLVEEVVRSSPQLVVLSASPPQLLALLPRLQHEGRRTHWIVRADPSTVELRDAVRGVENVDCIIGGARPEPRITELAITALGRVPRLHLPVDRQPVGELIEESGRVQSFRLINLSQTGAKITLQRVPEIGMPVQFRLFWLEHRLELEAVPTRRLANPDGSVAVGLEFEDPPDNLRALVDDFATQVQGGTPVAPPPRQRRVYMPAQVKLKARVTIDGATAVSYLPVKDLSVTGFSGTGAQAFAARFQPDQEVSVLLQWSGRSLRLRATVVRVAAGTPAALIAFRFIGGTRAARQQLRGLVTSVSKRGLSRSRRAQAI